MKFFISARHCGKTANQLLKISFIWSQAPETTLPPETTVEGLYEKKLSLLAESKLTLRDYPRGGTQVYK